MVFFVVEHDKGIWYTISLTFIQEAFLVFRLNIEGKMRLIMIVREATD